MRCKYIEVYLFLIHTLHVTRFSIRLLYAHNCQATFPIPFNGLSLVTPKYNKPALDQASFSSLSSI